MKKSALASVKSDRWRHLAPKYQTFGSIRVLKTGRFNFFSLHHYPQHKCGETLSPRCNGCVSMTQWWWARSSLSESRQPMEVKLEQLLRLQTTEGKRWNIETNLELSLISGPLNSVIAQTLWKSSVDLEYIYWDTATISCFWLLQYLKRFFTTLCIERGSFTGQYIRLLPSPGWNPSQLFLFWPTAKSRSISCSWVITPANNGLLYLVCYWKQLRRIHSDYKVEEHIISEKDEDGGLQQLVSKWDECSGNGVPASGYKCWDQCAEDTAKWWTYCWT